MAAKITFHDVMLTNVVKFLNILFSCVHIAVSSDTHA